MAAAAATAAATAPTASATTVADTPPAFPIPLPSSGCVRQGAGSGGASGRTGDSQQRIDVLEHAVGAATAAAITMHVLKGLESET